MIPVTYGQRFQSRTTKRTNGFIKTGVASSRLISFVLLALLALLYIAQSTQANTNAVKYQKLVNDSTDLINDNAQFNLDAQRLKSLSDLNNAAAQLGLEPAQTESYLTPKPTYQTPAN